MAKVADGKPINGHVAASFAADPDERRTPGTPITLREFVQLLDRISLGNLRVRPGVGPNLFPSTDALHAVVFLLISNQIGILKLSPR